MQADKYAAAPVGLPMPTTDLSELARIVGFAWGMSSEISVVQYLAWSERVDLFSVLAGEPADVQTICSRTVLTSGGADALLGVLASLGIATRNSRGHYGLSQLGRDYLLPASPYYVGRGLYYGRLEIPLPPAYVRQARAGARYSQRAHGEYHSDPLVRLWCQHSRNFAPAAVAVDTDWFDGATHILDVAGGSGVFCIPLALRYPDLKITLIETPATMAAVQPILAAYGVAHRVDLVAADAFSDESWRHLPPCDGIIYGNFLHAWGDRACDSLCRRALAKLSPAGRLWLHEMVWNDSRDGPLTAALWNAAMRAIPYGNARQRTAGELVGLLLRAGFGDARATPTSAGFCLLEAVKARR
jgi:hypothetical protein